MISGYGVIPGKLKPFITPFDEVKQCPFTVFVTGTFTPCIPLVAKDLNTTGAIVKSVASPFLPCKLRVLT
jgi:hypothetical protein